MSKLAAIAILFLGPITLNSAVSHGWRSDLDRVEHDRGAVVTRFVTKCEAASHRVNWTIKDMASWIYNWLHNSYPDWLAALLAEIDPDGTLGLTIDDLLNMTPEDLLNFLTELADSDPDAFEAFGDLYETYAQAKPCIQNHVNTGRKCEDGIKCGSVTCTKADGTGGTCTDVRDDDFAILCPDQTAIHWTCADSCASPSKDGVLLISALLALVAAGRRRRGIA